MTEQYIVPGQRWREAMEWLLLHGKMPAHTREQIEDNLSLFVGDSYLYLPCRIDNLGELGLSPSQQMLFKLMFS